MASCEKNSVVFVLPVFKEGGAEKSITTICEGIAARGYELHLIIIENRISFPFPKNTSTHVIGSDFDRKLPKWIKKHVYRYKINRLLAQLAPKAVFSSLPYSHKIVSKLKLDRSRVFFTIHNTPSDYISSKPAKKRRDIFRLKSLYDDRRIVTISAGVKEDMLHTLALKPRSIDVIYNPFDFNEIRALANAPTALPDAPYIINVGHFYKRKRHDTLLAAYHASGITHKLVLLGSRGDMSGVKKTVSNLKLEDKVVFAGWQSNPYPWIKKADLMVFTSEQEGLGRVLVESLVLATPVVSTDCPSGPREILTGELSGFLSPVGDADALSTNIKEALSNYPPITETLIDKFSVHHAIDGYIELIKGCHE